MTSHSRWAARAAAGTVAHLTSVVRSRRAHEQRAVRPGVARPPSPGWASVASAVSTAVAAVPAGHSTVHLPNRLPPVPVDQEQLDQALTTMVRYAWLRTPPGARVLVQAAAATDVLKVRVADRGPDVACEAKPWLLADPRNSGGSLQAAVRQLKASGSGRITLEDNPAGGLVLVLALPLTTHGRHLQP